MRDRRAPGALFLGSALSAVILLSGCGVKNDPVAPVSGQTPRIASPQPTLPANAVAASGATASVQPGARNEESVFADSSRIQSADGGGDLGEIIAPAEISRNASGQRRAFILDPLLN
ncbi:hypothetical protein [Antarcticirhabdus aurantiaca]|uniref:Uncharacterized protein n=1 Tax=Antarcticirhabdus aurantiaca TaxID=2606717 RepID=A0ACD4NT28_9HYPH|nr:hypothetical protein [Antarcticirhabdus aurantiaca]WAJ29855.1 hypothetical protein OXU80_06435 [Jeongeuplla avenae]